MIIIDTKYNNKYTNYIKIKGHAGYAEKGYDIVCASVSSIAITTVNASLKIDDKAITYSEEDGLLEINILKYNENINILIDNMLSMFKLLEKDYKDYIKIR